MSVALLLPTLTAPAALDRALRETGYAVLSAEGVATLAGTTPAALAALAPRWEDLPVDPHLRDGGRYRRRRHACFVVEGGRAERVTHRAHWQSAEYNALHGGYERWFEPMDEGMAASPALLLLLDGFARVAAALKGPRRYHVEAHPFRIETEHGIGRPTPEGAHRDGVDLVVVLLVARAGVKGGETRVFEADGRAGQRFTLVEPWSALILDDARVIHESTPIQPSVAGANAHRDTLVLTYRAGGFQGPTSRDLV